MAKKSKAEKIIKDIRTRMAQASNRGEKIEVVSIGDELQKQISPGMLTACKEIHECFLSNGDVMWEDLYFAIESFSRAALIAEFRLRIRDLTKHQKDTNRPIF